MILVGNMVPPHIFQNHNWKRVHEGQLRRYRRDTNKWCYFGLERDETYENQETGEIEYYVRRHFEYLMRPKDRSKY